MSRRKLRPDELELWNKVARTADRLNPERPEKKSLLDNTRKPSKDRPDPPEPMPSFELGSKAAAKPESHDLLPGLRDRLAQSPVQMDRKSYTRLKRGKLKPEGRIDLHGMTLDRAHPALMSFILSSHAKNRRLVLVITGKGKHKEDTGPIPTRPGVLRHNVPHWLSTPPLAQIVLQVTPAHLRHGGEGAYYVYLRRRRQ